MSDIAATQPRPALASAPVSAIDLAIADLLGPALRNRSICVVRSPQLARLFPQASVVKSFRVTVSTPAPRTAISRVIATAPVAAAPEPGAFDVILGVDPAELIASQRGLRPGTILGYIGPRAMRGEEPAAGFRLHILVNPVNGSLMADASFPLVRAVLLNSGFEPDAAAAHVILWSDRALPALKLGLYTRSAYPPAMDVEPPALTPRIAAVNASGRTPAVTLAERLQTVEQRMLTLRAENQRLGREAAANSATAPGASAFDVPRPRYPWPLADTPDLEPGALGLYDRRPDDPVLREAAAGAEFFAKFALDDEQPDFAAAVAALNATEAVLELGATAPDVSIVIPVYGQLPYSLNAIDSLFRHRARFSAEIIIIDDCSPDDATRQFLPLVDHIRYHRAAVNGGFIESCNIGGGMARGRYVMMLNSDTRLVAGCLDSLLDSFALFPHAGLVGSKMLYPDGSLQEAGGIIWRDGSAWNYGRDDDPNRPQYCYARQVDYISGCSIVLPKALWDQLGGFDRHFAPAYAEDADLSQRVIQAGLEVWFQPGSRVLHYEGKTSGTSTGGGVKAYQIINLKKLFLRWRERFENHRRNAQNPFLERERGVRKRLLLVDSVTPTPDQDAGSVQTVLALQCAQRRGYKVSFVPQDNWLFVPRYTSPLQQSGVDCSYAPYELGFDAYIRRYGWLFDVILTYRVHVMDACLALIRAHAPQATVIFHVADLHYLRMERQAALDGSEAAMLAAAEMRDKEFDLIQRVDCTITHSTAEADILAQELPGAPVVTWPLMMEFAGTTIGFKQRRNVCFLGGYRHPPNVDAVVFFVREVFPLLREVEPGIRFIIAGANPTREVEDLACDDIVVTGMIENLRDVFDACRVFVCPLRVGAGVKGKIMSALSYGVPVVSTAVGVEGAGLTDGLEVLVADAPTAFAAAVMRLYRDKALWGRLSKAGQATIRREFSVDMGQRKLDEAVDRAYRQKLGLPLGVG